MEEEVIKEDETSNLHKSKWESSKEPNHLEELIEKHTNELKKEIAERKKMEDALRESEKKYCALVENSKDGIVIIQDGVLKFVNRASMEMVGASYDEMIGTDFLYWVAPKSLDLVKKRYADRIAGKDVPNIYEVTLSRKNGTFVSVEVSANLIDYEGRSADLVFIRDITQRKRAEKALQKSEERLIAFMESAPDLFALLDSELNLVDINRIGIKTMFSFGTKKRDIRGKNIAELLPYLEESGMYDRYKEVIRTGRPFSVDSHIPHPNFGEQYLSFKVFRVGDGLGIIARNITERKQMEEALRESEERLKTIFSSLDDLVFVLDKNGIFLDYFQPSKLSEMYVPPREFLGSSYKDIMPPAIVKLMEDAELALADTGEVQQFDYPLIIGGKKMWFSAKVSMRRDNLGNFAGYTMVARNITARKKAEEDIMGLASAMKMSTDSVIISDIEGNIIDVNDATLRLYGIEDSKDILGKSSFTLLLPGAEEKALALMEELLEKGDLKNREIEVIIPDGSVRIMEVSISLLRDSEGKVNGTVGISRDITLRKRAEDELNRYKDHLEELIEERTAELKNEIAEREKAEEALRKSEERFRLAAISSSDLIYEWDVFTGDLLWFGDIDSALGFEPGEFPRTLEAWVNQIHPDDQTRLLDSVKLHRESTEPIFEEYRIKRKDGKWCSWVDRGTPVLDNEGRPRKWIGACIDITEGE